MKQSIFQEKYPVFTLEVEKSETAFASADEIVDHLKKQVEGDPNACLIAVFDHYGHTRSLPNGEINPAIHAAKNLVFCFGVKLPGPEVMAVRPRSIGVTELDGKYVLNFLEAPMPLANTAMEGWVKSVQSVAQQEVSQ